MYAVLIPEAPVAVVFEPLCAREVCCIHVDDPVVHIGVVVGVENGYDEGNVQISAKISMSIFYENDSS